MLVSAQRLVFISIITLRSRFPLATAVLVRVSARFEKSTTINLLYSSPSQAGQLDF